MVLNVITDKGNHFYHVNFMKWYVSVKEKRVKNWRVVTLKFKKIERFQVLQMSGNIPIDTESKMKNKA